MAQTLEEQIVTIERSLGERMIGHALTVVRTWLNELGETNPFEKAYLDIQQNYTNLFSRWVSANDEGLDKELDHLTGNTYRLVDAVYADIRLQRGVSPLMHSFNENNLQSVMHYFSNHVHPLETDLEWLAKIIRDPSRGATALMAVSSIAHGLRQCFSEESILTLIDGINSGSDVIAEQCLSNVILLLAHYDIRIDYFPDIQNAFANAVAEMNDDGEQAFQTLCSLVLATNDEWLKNLTVKELRPEDVPQELKSLLEATGEDSSLNGIQSIITNTEKEYMRSIIDILPDTWVYNVVVGEGYERQNRMALTYLTVGRMDMVWDNIELASRWLLEHLRKGANAPQDYINYGHCMLLQGDRVMAFENYRQARLLCKSSKDFYNLFRPDRKALVDHGVPLEQVYLIEDQLLKV